MELFKLCSVKNFGYVNISSPNFIGNRSTSFILPSWLEINERLLNPVSYNCLEIAERGVRPPSVLRTFDYLLYLCLQRVMFAPTPRSVEDCNEVPSPRMVRTSPDLKCFTRVRFYLPGTPTHGIPSPIAGMTCPELSQGAKGFRSSLPSAPVPRRRFGVIKTATPGLGA